MVERFAIPAFQQDTFLYAYRHVFKGAILTLKGLGTGQTYPEPINISRAPWY